jgi:hypothetical protein
MATSSTGRWAFSLATAAVCCAVAFTVWALTASVYASGETLLEANPELSVRVALGLPLVVTLAVWSLLHAACRLNAKRARTAATIIAALLVAFAAVTGFSIGMFVMPGAALLLAAALLTPVASD